MQAVEFQDTISFSVFLPFWMVEKAENCVVRTRFGVLAVAAQCVCVMCLLALAPVVGYMLINRVYLLCVLFACCVSYWISSGPPRVRFRLLDISCTDVGIFNEIRGNHTLVIALQILLNLFAYLQAVVDAATTHSIKWQATKFALHWGLLLLPSREPAPMFNIYFFRESVGTSLVKKIENTKLL